MGKQHASAVILAALALLASCAVGCRDQGPELASGVVQVDGVWDWTERISGASVTCSDTGSYSFTRVGATFDGLSRQVGSCRTPGDNTHTDPVYGGIVSGVDVSFTVGTGRTCTYTAQATGSPTPSLTGTVSCSDGSTGTWSAVRQQPVGSVTIIAPTVTMLPGITAPLVAQLADARGNRVFSRSLTWTSDQPGVATVVPMTYDSARVTGVTSGSATITASTESPHGRRTGPGSPSRLTGTAMLKST